MYSETFTITLSELLITNTISGKFNIDRTITTEDEELSECMTFDDELMNNDQFDDDETDEETGLFLFEFLKFENLTKELLVETLSNELVKYINSEVNLSNNIRNLLYDNFEKLIEDKLITLSLVFDSAVNCVDVKLYS
jgi:hypothetical protein